MTIPNNPEVIMWYGEQFRRTHEDRIDYRLPLQNGRRTSMPDYIEYEDANGLIVQINPENVLRNGRKEVVDK